MKSYKELFLPDFIEICAMPQATLHKFLYQKLTEFGYVVDDSDKWLFAKGEIDILLTSHMDTVHKEQVNTVQEVKDIYGRHVLSSPQGIGGDDRCGIYIILKLLERGYRPHILFTEDEEIGGIGAEDFVKKSKGMPSIEKAMKSSRFMIELDRANSNDAVFYDCDNPDFTEFILETIPYKEEIGSFSDISILAPAFKVAAVNLSCGYYKAHTTSEYVIQEEMLNTVIAVEALLTAKTEPFEYIEAKYSWNPRWSGYNYKYSWDWDDYDSFFDDDIPSSVTLEVCYYKKDEFHYVHTSGDSFDNALLQFFKDNPTICYADIVQCDYV